MARLHKEKSGEKTEKCPPRQCADCGQKADVYVGEHGFCCEHYSARVTRMRRNADKLVLDGNVYRPATEQERELREKVDANVAKNRGYVPPPQKAREEMKTAASFAAKYRGR